MSAIERMSLRRCDRVLGRYPKVLVGPEGMDVSAYRSEVPGLHYQSFDSCFFRSERGYNALLCRAPFYDAFANYDFMLIYQLDCYVFEDALDVWCGRGYDFVGAPFLDFEWLKNSLRLLSRLPGLSLALGKVGNGGFSLRRVSTFRRAARVFAPIAAVTNCHEDLYWTSIVARLYPGFRIPETREALSFAFERTPEKCLEITGGVMPFGCHAFEKYGIEFWRERFEPEDVAQMQ